MFSLISLVPPLTNSLTQPCQTQELSQAREQLGEATLALEQAQVSRGETVNRLSRSLEESQRRCQELLQQLGADSAARELSTLRVKLEQSQESTRISEELCRSYQVGIFFFEDHSFNLLMQINGFHRCFTKRNFFFFKQETSWTIVLI